MNDTDRQIKPPTPLDTVPDGTHTVFLAGSIDQGAAVDWQAQVVEALAHDVDVAVLNPRRDEWEASWPQRADFTPFRDQVEWELDALDRADLIAVYFAPGTRAPITLLELGLYASSGRLIVCCPDGYWRKGNVDIVCERHGVQQVDTLDGLIKALNGHFLTTRLRART